VATEEVVLIWRNEGAKLVDALVVVVIPGVDEEVLEEDESWLCALLYCKSPF